MSRTVRFKRGLNPQVVSAISQEKNEPAWMHDFRLRGLEIFKQKDIPSWGADLSALDLQDIRYYVRMHEGTKKKWDDVPTEIKETFEKLGIPQAEREMLAGVGAQFESEVIYKSLQKEWASQGVIFCDTETALREHSDLFKKYFATVIPPDDNTFAALNSAVWSGGSFVYVPKGVRITKPLQAYFRINEAKMGQFERTLIIAEEDSFVHYVEGCSAPLYSSSSLHSAVVEIIAHPRSEVRYTTIQNWAPNVYNLVTKRAIAYQDAKVAWIDGNFGSYKTMKYPCVVLAQPGAQGEVMSIAVAAKNQHQDAGAKMIHLASNTSSTIISKSISKDGGRSSYRGLVKVAKNAKKVISRVQCEALLLDDISRSDTYPTMIINEGRATIGHEASVSKVGDEQLMYCMSRGMSKQSAHAMVVNGFIEPFVSLLPMEYAVEINRLIEHEMEGSVG
jgi:Fe-S cluster assembly protein SufB